MSAPEVEVSLHGCLALFLLSGFLADQRKAEQAATLVEKSQPRAVIILPNKPLSVAKVKGRITLKGKPVTTGSHLPPEPRSVEGKGVPARCSS